MFSCDRCPNGWVQPETGKANCTSCQAGQYGKVVGELSEGVLQCTPCPLGLIAGYASANCTSCPSGTAATEEQDRCESCAAGKYGKVIDDGRVSGEIVLQCTACESGLFSTGAADECSVCGDGLEARDDSTGCDPCATGKAGTGGSCTLCDEDKFTDDTGRSACVLCTGCHATDRTCADSALAGCGPDGRFCHGNGCDGEYGQLRQVRCVTPSMQGRQRASYFSPDIMT